MQSRAQIVIALAGFAPLSGEVQTAGQPSRPFAGWIGLPSALQTAAGALAGAANERESH